MYTMIPMMLLRPDALEDVRWAQNKGRIVDLLGEKDKRQRENKTQSISQDELKPLILVT